MSLSLDTYFEVLADTSTSGRELVEMSFEGPSSQKIGNFPAHDYFGDGSFYLLDSPGHAVGHLCGLVRTTCNPDTFVLLGSDVCHYAGVLRPSQHLSVPPRISPHPYSLHDDTTFFCPGSAWDDLQRSRGREPTDTLFDSIFAHDVALATKTVRWLQELDCNENVFVIVAHDATVLDAAPRYPQTLNDWKSRDLGRKLKWAFLRDLEWYWKFKGLS